MARAPAGLPAGIRVSDHISLGVIARTFPLGQVRQVLAETGRASERQRDLPAHVMVYYAVALALYMDSGTREVLRCLLEGLRWLWGAEAVRVAGKSGISQARTRLGEAPLRRLYERLVRPVATPATKGAWYREWRLVSLDGSCLDVADTAENGAAFGRPGDGSYLSTIYPGEKDRRHAGAGGRVPLGGRGRRRAAVPAGDDDPRPGRGARDGAGGPVPRAVGDRGCAGRAEDPPARRADGPAQQDAGLGPAGVLGAAAGALRGARADARGGAARRRGPRPALLPARRTGGAPQAAPVRRASPLGPGPPCTRRFWPRSRWHR